MVEGLQYFEDQNMFVSHNQDATIALGKLLGEILNAGDNIILTGDLGAGKTQLTKGIAEVMGIEEDITSPTFTIQMIYEGEKLPLYHFDLYRVNDSDELGDCGLWDVLGDDGVCIMEWGEQFADEVGNERLDIVVERLDNEIDSLSEPPRSIRLIPHDERGQQIIKNLKNKFNMLV